MKKLIALFLCIASSALAQTAYSPDSRPHSAHASLSSITHPPMGLNFNGVNLVGAPNLLSIQNGANPQYLSIYGATGSNAEYTQIGYGSASGPFTINTNKTGTGVTNFQIQNGGTTILDYGVTAASTWSYQNSSAVNIQLPNNSAFYLGSYGALSINGSNGSLGFTTSSAAGSSTSVDTYISRSAAGVLAVGATTGTARGTQGDTKGAIRAAAYQASGGSAPTLTTGSCSGSSWTGGATAGKFTAPACAAGTIILSGLPASPYGYACYAADQTTPANTLQQTANSTTSVTFAATTTNLDVVAVHCIGF